MALCDTWIIGRENMHLVMSWTFTTTDTGSALEKSNVSVQFLRKSCKKQRISVYLMLLFNRAKTGGNKRR
jgi:hypothetical protein